MRMSVLLELSDHPGKRDFPDICVRSSSMPGARTRSPQRRVLRKANKKS